MLGAYIYGVTLHVIFSATDWLKKSGESLECRSLGYADIGQMIAEGGGNDGNCFRSLFNLDARDGLHKSLRAVVARPRAIRTTTVTRGLCRLPLRISNIRA